MRISDWSSDVCSSDLAVELGFGPGDFLDELGGGEQGALLAVEELAGDPRVELTTRFGLLGRAEPCEGLRRDHDRKSVVSGKSVSVRVDLGGRRLLNTKTYNTTNAAMLNKLQ